MGPATPIQGQAARAPRRGPYLPYLSGNGARAVALRGSLWTIGGYGAGQVVRLGSSLILTRLLFPEAFGLMTLVGVVMIGLQMFSDIGIGPSIIQSKRGSDPVFLNTAWTLQVIRSIGLALIAFALAWPVARFYEKPALLGLLPIVALTVMVNGFQTTAMFTLNREMNLGRLMVFGLATQVFGVVVTVIWAWVSPNVYAIAYGALIAAVAGVATGFHVLPGHRHRFCWDEASRQELFKFGKWIFLSTVAGFFALQADKVLLGKLITSEQLGVYTIALTLVTVGRNLAMELSRRILMPSLAAGLRQSPEQFAGALRKGRTAILLLGAIMLSGAIGMGPPFFHLLYDKRYEGAANLSQLLGVTSWPFFLLYSLQQILLAQGRSAPVLVGTVTNLVVSVAAAPLMYKFYGLQGFVVGYAFGDLAAAVVFNVILARTTTRAVVAQDLWATLAFAVLCASAYPAARLGHAGATGTAIGLAGIVVWLLVALVAVRSISRSGLRRSPAAKGTPPAAPVPA